MLLAPHPLSAELEVNWYKQLQASDSAEPIESLESSSYSNEAVWNESLSSSAMNKSTKAAGPSSFKRLVASAAAHWMIWFGGASIGFSGIFFVKYSLDNNLLGLQARILVSPPMSALLHVCACKLHQIKGRYAAIVGHLAYILAAVVLAREATLILALALKLTLLYGLIDIFACLYCLI